MKKSEAVKILTKAGYTLLRVSKHEIWEKDGHEIPIHKGGKLKSYEGPRLRSQIRSASR